MDATKKIPKTSRSHGRALTKTVKAAPKDGALAVGVNCLGGMVGIQRQETLIHWNFFLSIEEDLDRLGRFVDFSANEESFSIEIARLFLAASAEVDVVLKQRSEEHTSELQSRPH